MTNSLRRLKFPHLIFQSHLNCKTALEGLNDRESIKGASTLPSEGSGMSNSSTKGGILTPTESIWLLRSKAPCFSLFEDNVESVITLGRPEICFWYISSQFRYEELKLVVLSERKILLLAFKAPRIGDLEKARSIHFLNEPGPFPLVIEGESLGQAPDGSPRQQGTVPAKQTRDRRALT
jgi:hypothetical protein